MIGLRLEAVEIDIAGRALLRLDLAVPPGEVVTVMGPSGAGKSALLRFVAGALPPAFSARGRISLDGADLAGVPPEARRIGILFQDDLLFPHLSVAGNLLFALKGGTRAQRRGRVAASLAEAGLAGMEERDPASLSGGQRARVALLRVLLSEPRALLLDEPFSKLDLDLRRQIRSQVFDEARRLGLPTLLVTHDPDDAAAAGGPVLSIAPPA